MHVREGVAEVEVHTRIINLGRISTRDTGQERKQLRAGGGVEITVNTVDLLVGFAFAIGITEGDKGDILFIGFPADLNRLENSGWSSLRPARLLNLLDRIDPGRQILETEPAATAGLADIRNRIGVNAEFPAGKARLAGIANTVAVEILVLGDTDGTRQALATERVAEIETHHPGIILDIEIDLAVLQLRQDIHRTTTDSGES